MIQPMNKRNWYVCKFNGSIIKEFGTASKLLGKMDPNVQIKYKRRLYVNPYILTELSKCSDKIDIWDVPC